MDLSIEYEGHNYKGINDYTYDFSITDMIHYTYLRLKKESFLRLLYSLWRFVCGTAYYNCYSSERDNKKQHSNKAQIFYHAYKHGSKA